MIELRDVTKTFGSGNTAVSAVNNLSFTLPEGAFWTLMGPSGSGKSTVLHLIAGLTPPTTGSVLVSGADVASLAPRAAAILRRSQVGYVLQAFNLMPFLTAEENVGMPLVLGGVPQREVDERSRAALALVDLSARARHKPGQMSGGEQQRVAVARALVIRPTVVLADEPTGNLDRGSGRSVMDLFRDVNEKTGVTVLMVTHDPIFAAYSQRVLRLVDGGLDQDIDLSENGRGAGLGEGR